MQGARCLKTLQTAPLCCPLVLGQQIASLRPCPIGVLSPCCSAPHCARALLDLLLCLP